MVKRVVVLDTETTGLEPRLGHRIIEIGCVEVIDRKVTGKIIINILILNVRLMKALKKFMVLARHFLLISHSLLILWRIF